MPNSSLGRGRISDGDGAGRPPGRQVLSRPLCMQEVDDYFRGQLTNPPLTTYETDPGFQLHGSSVPQLLIAPSIQPHPAKNYPEDYQQMTHTDSEVGASESMSIVTRLADSAPHGLIDIPTRVNETDVYSRYLNDSVFKGDAALPIMEHKESILDTIAQKRVTIIHGDTGCGKTTQVPQFILEECMAEGLPCNIVVTQPRRVAATSVAYRVASQNNWTVPGIVGYRIGMERDKANADTRLLYCTTGVLKQQLVNRKTLSEYTHIILDEVHERDQETDFCMLILKTLMHRSDSKHVKIILMSATVEVQAYRNYFTTKHVDDEITEVPDLIQMTGRPFNVTMYFLENLAHLINLNEIPEQDELEPSISDEIFELMRLLVTKEFVTRDSGMRERGAVLIFVPGQDTITKVVDMLQTCTDANTLQVLPLFSKITHADQMMALKPAPPGMRKVVVSTNIAESSLTVPDVRYVIDLCLTKVLMLDEETQYSSLQLCWASQANCQQRSGRAGRVQDGYCFRLVPQKFYKCLQPYPKPDFVRMPLRDVVLQIKKLNMGTPLEMCSRAMSQPTSDSVMHTINQLHLSLALTPKHDDLFDGHLTMVGEILSGLPIDLKLGKLIVFGYIFGVLDNAVMIAALLSVRDIIVYKYDSMLDTYMYKIFFSKDSRSDPLVYLYAYKKWLNTRASLRNSQQKRSWLRDNYLQEKRLLEVEHLVNELWSRLRAFNITGAADGHLPNMPDRTPAEMETLLLMALTAAFYPNYFISSKKEERQIQRELSGYDPYSTVVLQGLPQCRGYIYHEQIESQFKKIITNIPQFNPDDLRIIYEQSKAYVQFKQPGNQSKCPYSYGVLKALKSRMLFRQGLTYFEYDDQCVEERCVEIEYRMREDAKAQRKLPSARFEVVDVRPVGVQASSKVELPALDTFNCRVRITWAEDACHFWVQYAEVARRQRLADLTMSIANMVHTKRHKLQTRPARGMLVLAPYMDVLYRAEVKDVNERFATVQYVDYGNMDDVPRAGVFVCPDDLNAFQLPYQAFRLHLAHVEPVGSAEAGRNYVTNPTQDKDVFAHIYSVVGDVVKAELRVKKEGTTYGANQSTTTEVNIADKVVAQGFAQIAKESAASQADHNTREELASRRSSSGQYTSYESPVFKVSKAEIGANRMPRNGRRDTLRGPFHPGQLEWRSPLFSSRTLSCKFEPDSVNCICMDYVIAQEYQQLLVAANTGLNQDRTRVIMRQTTVMPAKIGLPSLAFLTFSPAVELRMMHAGHEKRLVGALCGLGYSSLLQAPIGKTQDAEVNFDTEITVEDIQVINRIRTDLSALLDCETRLLTTRSDKMLRTRRNVQDNILALLQKPRAYVEPVYMETHTWKTSSSVSEHDTRPELLRPIDYMNVQLDPEELKRHAVELKSLASLPTNKRPVKAQCNFCNIQVDGITLPMHLISAAHRNNVKASIPSGLYFNPQEFA